MLDQATVAAARHAAKRTKAGKLVSVAGGGDTVAALNHAHVAEDFTYISTAGGALLEWMEGKALPGVAFAEGDLRGWSPSEPFDVVFSNAALQWAAGTQESSDASADNSGPDTR